MSTDRLAHPGRGMRVVGLLLALLWILGIAAVVWWFWPRGSIGLNPSAQPRAVTARGDLSAMEKTNIAIYNEASPSVVHITSLTTSTDRFHLNEREVAKGTGSGIIWDKEGHIVTNYHVVQGANGARVILSDHSTYEARQIWVDQDKDIAVISIDAPADKLHPIQIGTSHDLQVGQVTYAIGNPFGLDQTMTVGIVSALDREIDAANGHPIRGAIQTSAAINPGNSGGPLLDSAGRLIGMNTAIISPSGASAGIGFAIPVDEINRIAPQLIQHGRVVRPRLGVQVAADQLAHQLGVKEGALILKVIPDTAAAKAGLQGTRRDADGRIRLGDVIITLEEHSIRNVDDLYAALDQFKVGQTVTLVIDRESQRQEIQVTLEAQQ